MNVGTLPVKAVDPPRSPHFCAIQSQAAVSMPALYRLDILQGHFFFPGSPLMEHELILQFSVKTTAEDAVSFFKTDSYLPEMTPADYSAASLSWRLVLQQSGLPVKPKHQARCLTS